MLVLPAICCWFVLGPVPSGQASEADCLVDVVLLCSCFMQSRLFYSVCVAMAAVIPGCSIAVLGVAAICSLAAIHHPS